ncbi:hypothetical protein PanWU01x14_271120 [Parasponia andersonii]|uniref:Uncharacterized protein n=1 Tax=Parasponia andersonii TaxID=3476 RepID=A0A2P5B4V7_PARAD|nr:hypothetical protein PanWU01x14_271120 [Parasponia andersonii]
MLMVAEFRYLEGKWTEEYWGMLYIFIGRVWLEVVAVSRLLLVSQLLSYNAEFRHSPSSLYAELSYLPPSSFAELKEFITIEWGGLVVKRGLFKAVVMVLSTR